VRRVGRAQPLQLRDEQPDLVVHVHRASTAALRHCLTTASSASGTRLPSCLTAQRRSSTRRDGARRQLPCAAARAAVAACAGALHFLAGARGPAPALPGGVQGLVCDAERAQPVDAARPVRHGRLGAPGDASPAARRALAASFKRFI
jgi:hypothetical protein